MLPHMTAREAVPKDGDAMMTNSDGPEGGPMLRGARSFAAFLRQFMPGPIAWAQPRILVVVEGPNDIEFVRRISAILHREDPKLPDLAVWEGRLDLVFVPSGGGDVSLAFRFAGLKLPEFHLLDRDVSPATESRQCVAAMVNSRPGCRAVVTSKRSLENYLLRTILAKLVTRQGPGRIRDLRKSMTAQEVADALAAIRMAIPAADLRPPLLAERLCLWALKRALGPDRAP
jgi:hypothetical protein